MYLHDPRTVGVRDVMSERETPPQGPAFRLECAAGCPPLAANRCRAVVRQANVDAIELARNAAMALESTPPSREAARLFRAFFGHDPSRPVPWAGNRFFRGGVVLHEMLHLLYHQFFHHAGRHRSGDPERRRDNAHCYEAFALQLAGHVAEPGDVAGCCRRPA
jgi:hypothetical protein